MNVIESYLHTRACIRPGRSFLCLRGVRTCACLHETHKSFPMREESEGARSIRFVKLARGKGHAHMGL